MTKAAIRQIPLNKLVLSPKNVRKTKASDAEDAELQASIREMGLKQNLLVHETDGMFHVHAGGRRLAALQRLAEEGNIRPDSKIPCRVESMEDAAESSTAENVIRARMHPADQFVAFVQLIEQGRAIEEIANRFGITADLVKRRLKLAKVAPEILEAFRSDEMSLEAVMAFTLSDDHDRQREIWNQVSQQYSIHPNSIKRMLTETSCSASSRLAKYVGLEAYEAAGGRITRDLFSDHDSVYLDDVSLLEQLAQQKLEEEANGLRAQWKWAEIQMDVHYGGFQDYGRVYPQQGKEDPALMTEQKELQTRLNELTATCDVESWTTEQEAEEARLNDRLDDIERQIEDNVVYSEEQMAIAGCIVSVSNYGELDIKAGLVRPEDIPSQSEQEAATDGAGEGTSPDGEAESSEPAGLVVEQPHSMTQSSPVIDPVTAARKEEGMSKALADDLRAIRHQILQVHLSADYETAFDAMLYSMCKKTLALGYTATPLDVSLTAANTHNSSSVLTDTIASQMLDEIRKGLNLGWMEKKAPEDFAALCELPQEDKQALFAWTSAHALVQQLADDGGASPVIEQLGTRMQVDVAKCWRPTSESYWSRVKKDHSLQIARDLISDQWANDRSSLKKAQLAASMERAFADNASEVIGLSAGDAAKTSQWLPGGMSFAGIDDGASGNEASSDQESEDQIEEGVCATDDEGAGDDPDLPAFLTAAE